MRAYLKSASYTFKLCNSTFTLFKFQCLKIFMSIKSVHCLKFPRKPYCLSNILWLSVKGLFSVNKNSTGKVFFVHIGLYSFYPVKNRMLVEWAWRNHIDMNVIGTDVGPGTIAVELYTTRTGVLILHHYFQKLLTVFKIAS